MLYELRVYHCVPGRLPDLLKRFGDSNQALYYLLKWESLADREKKWNAFQADPEWHTKRAETEKNGAIVARVENSILQPTAFSAVK
jgi:hypothetical protein